MKKQTQESREKRPDRRDSRDELAQSNAEKKMPSAYFEIPSPILTARTAVVSGASPDRARTYVCGHKFPEMVCAGKPRIPPQTEYP